MTTDRLESIGKSFKRTMHLHDLHYTTCKPKFFSPLIKDHVNAHKH